MRMFMPIGKKRTFPRFFYLTFLTLLMLFFYSGCSGNGKPDAVSEAGGPSPKEAKATAAVKSIQSEAEFKKIVEASPGRLLVFDLYADWCRPCRILSPMLDEIAEENKDKANFYKINVDRFPQLAATFQVRGIPHVSFVKDKNLLHTFTGVRAKGDYVNAVGLLSGALKESQVKPGSGELAGGVRVIRFKAGIDPQTVYVFRGETVKLIIEKQNFPFSVSVPDFKATGEAAAGQDLEISFKAKTLGVYPIFCNGNCPAGDGAQHGKIVVMQYEAEGDAQYEELTAEQAFEKIQKESPLILDVRTPREYYGGYIPQAKLIPLQQLEARLAEIDEYKDKDILVYCRSGNRSTVAAEILIRKGFKKLFNLRSGIRGWMTQKYPVEGQRENPRVTL